MGPRLRGGLLLDQSLTLILPVHDAQISLATQVGNLLEVLPELTSDFEILIIDDGSTDRTEEVAYELQVEYPQVRVHRNPVRRGTASSVQLGLQMSTSDVVMVQDENQVRPSRLQRLWELRHDQQLVMARADADPIESTTPIDPGVIQRLFTWGNGLTGHTEQRHPGGIHMIRRKGVHQLKAHDPLTVETY